MTYCNAIAIQSLIVTSLYFRGQIKLGPRPDWSPLEIPFKFYIRASPTFSWQSQKAIMLQYPQFHTKILGHQSSSPLSQLTVLIIRWFFPFLLTKHDIFNHWLGRTEDTWSSSSVPSNLSGIEIISFLPSFLFHSLPAQCWFHWMCWFR